MQFLLRFLSPKNLPKPVCEPLVPRPWLPGMCPVLGWAVRLNMLHDLVFTSTAENVIRMTGTAHLQDASYPSDFTGTTHLSHGDSTETGPISKGKAGTGQRGC